MMKKKRYRGHYCRICGDVKPNEAFSGKGHRRHICKVCARMPAEDRDAIIVTQQVCDLLMERKISPKSIAKLKRLAESPNREVADTADLVLQVALVAPRERDREEILKKNHPELFRRLIGAPWQLTFEDMK